jgi:antibiotic biosynthesis monooxygenase (ABM) superfamily enzyme
MSTSPVTLMVARRVAHGRYQELIAWLHEGEQLATDFPGYLGSGVLAPPPGDDEFQIIFRFADEATMHAWEHSASRRSWLVRGSGLFAKNSVHRVRGMDGWFGTVGQRPPRWKQAVAIWLAFFPVSLIFNYVLGPLLGQFELLPRIMISTLILTPLMVFWFIPLSTHLLSGWLNRSTQMPIAPAESASTR